MKQFFKIMLILASVMSVNAAKAHDGEGDEDKNKTAVAKPLNKTIFIKNPGTSTPTTSGVSATNSLSSKTLAVNQYTTGMSSLVFTKDGKTAPANHFKSKYVGKTTFEEWKQDFINTINTGVSERLNDIRVTNVQMMGLYATHVMNEFSELYPTGVTGDDLKYIAENAKPYKWNEFCKTYEDFAKNYEVSYVGEDGKLHWFRRNPYENETFAFFNSKILLSSFCANGIRFNPIEKPAEPKYDPRLNPTPSAPAAPPPASPGYTKTYSGEASVTNVYVNCGSGTSQQSEQKTIIREIVTQQGTSNGHSCNGGCSGGCQNTQYANVRQNRSGDFWRGTAQVALGTYAAGFAGRLTYDRWFPQPVQVFQRNIYGNGWGGGGYIPPNTGGPIQGGFGSGGFTSGGGPSQGFGPGFGWQ